jgi:hypothetical protein
MVGIEKAKRLAPTVEVEKIGSSYYFKVHSNEEREVIYKNGKWGCDCEWFSVKGTPCSHILAARMKLNALESATRGEKAAEDE